MAETQRDIDDLKRLTGITDVQLNDRINYSRDEKKLWKIAGFMGRYKNYVGKPGFDLNETDIDDLKDCAKDTDHQHAMKMAFDKWLSVPNPEPNPNPKPITYRSLVDILIELRKKTVAEKVCGARELFRASYTQCALSLFIVLY